LDTFTIFLIVVFVILLLLFLYLPFRRKELYYDDTFLTDKPPTPEELLTRNASALLDKLNKTQKEKEDNHE